MSIDVSVMLVAVGKMPTDTDEQQASAAIDRFGKPLLKSYLNALAQRTPYIPQELAALLAGAFLSGFGSGVIRTLDAIEEQDIQAELESQPPVFESDDRAVSSATVLFFGDG